MHIDILIVYVALSSPIRWGSLHLIPRLLISQCRIMLLHNSCFLSVLGWFHPVAQCLFLFLFFIFSCAIDRFWCGPVMGVHAKDVYDPLQLSKGGSGSVKHIILSPSEYVISNLC